MLDFPRIESAGVRPAAAMWSWGFLALLLLASVSVDSGRAAAALADNEAVGETRLDESWPQWRGPMRDGKSTTTGIRRRWPEGGPELVWTSEGAGSGYASVTIADGMLFSTGNQNGRQVVSAFSLDEGAPLWATPVTESVPDHGYSGSRTTPTYDEGRLYIVSSDGQIGCLSAADGEVIWKRSFADWGGRMMSGWGFSESPLVDGGNVICTPGGDEASLVALNKLDGEEVWRAVVPAFGDRENRGGTGLSTGAAYSSIVISEAAGTKQYVQLLGQGIVGVAADSGRFLWGYDDVANNVANIPTPIAIGDSIFCSTGYGTGSALLNLSRAGRNRVQAEEAYFLDGRQLQNHHGGLIHVDGYIYGGHGHNNGFPFCLDVESGEIVWGGDQRGPGSGSAAVTFVDGMLIFRYENGVVALIEANPEGYELSGAFTPVHQEGKSWAHPVVVNGRLYLREQDKLMCYDLR